MSLSLETQKQLRKTLNYKQDRFIFSSDHYTCIKGTWGCGKSLAGLYAANRECEEYPNNLYLIIRKEWVDLRDSTLHDWDREIGRPINGDKNVIYPNGSVLMFRHGEDLNALKNTNLGGALMVQAEEHSEDDFWFLNGRLRRQEGSRQLRLECNYDGHNWIYRLFNEQKVGTLITTNTFDNKDNLPPDYIPNLMKLPKKLRDRHLYGSDAEMEGVIWDEFEYSRNVVSPFEIPKEWPGMVILDHGFTNPTAVLWFKIDWDGNVYVYDEHYEAGKVISYHSSRIKERDNSNIQRWLIDPSCRSKTQGKEVLHSIIDEYAEYGLKFNPANNDELAGINKVNEFFKAGRLRIFKSCVNTIREVQNWKWRTLKPTQEKNQPDEPVDKENHTCDCLKYGILDLIRTPIKDDSEPLNPLSAWGQHILKEREAEGFIYRH